VAEQREDVALLNHQVDVIDSCLIPELLLETTDLELVPSLSTQILLLPHLFLHVGLGLGQEVQVHRLRRLVGDRRVLPEGGLQEEEGALTRALLLGESEFEVHSQAELDDIADDAALEGVGRTEAVDLQGHVGELESSGVGLQSRNDYRLEVDVHHGQDSAPGDLGGHLECVVLNDHQEDTPEVDQHAHDRCAAGGVEQGA